MSAPIAFVDCETTGLDPDQHQIWEVALITPDAREHVWQFPVDEMTADPFALNIGRYWDRCWPAGIREVSDLDAIYEAHSEKSRRKNFPSQGRAIKPDADWCRHFRDLTAGLHLAGAVVSFDEDDKSTSTNRIYTAFYGNMVTPGSTSNMSYNHSSLLRTIEDNFALGNLGQNDASASPITGVWR